MLKISLRWTVCAICLLALALPLPGFAGPLDDHYLAAFAAKQTGSALEKALLAPVTGTAEPAHCGTPLKHGLSRDWNKLEPATRKVLDKQLAAPVLTDVVTSSGGHFTIHFNSSGSDAPKVDLINQYSTQSLARPADWAAQVGDAFEIAYSKYLSLGYHMPPTKTYQVYLTSLASAGEYGVTEDSGMIPSTGFPFASNSFITIDKDFTDPIYKPQTYTPLQSLQITSAHEFHHAVQYSYNFFFEIWYAEATSTWFEDEVADSINQNYSYLDAWFQNSAKPLDLAVDANALSSGAGYGRWIFNRYLAEQHDPAMVRAVWERLAGLDPASSPVNSDGDMKMTPVLDAVLSSSYQSTLGAELFGFAKRAYTRDWTSHTSEIPRIPAAVPLVAAYSSYPVPLTSAGLPHYSFAYYKFLPSTTAPADLRLTLSGSSSTSAVVAFRTGTDGVITSFAPDQSTGVITVPAFNSGLTAEVQLLVCNSGSTDGAGVNFSSDGSTSSVVNLVPGAVGSGATNSSTSGSTTSGSSTTAPASSSGKNGCFIATAAYGSYLHPKVALLRAFRDNYLLTNPPGRLFVALYYRLSPPLADLVARHAVLRGATRLLLAPVVLAVEHGRAALLLFCFGIALTVAGRVRTVRAGRPSTVA